MTDTTETDRKRGSGARLVYDTLRDEILNLILAPGEIIDEAALADRLSMSRTPIREAISLLAGEGLVEIRPRRGAVVASVSPQRLLEMFDVMAELESMCARLAARRVTEDDLARLQEAHQACQEAAQRKDADGYFYANERFHQALYAAAQNHFLMEQATALQRRLRPYRRLQLRVRNRVQHSFEEHQSILDAIRDGNLTQAAQATRGHVAIQGERFTDLLASLAPFGLEKGPELVR